jgi:type 1 glutamine amidotransferase
MNKFLLIAASLPLVAFADSNDPGTTEATGQKFERATGLTQPLRVLLAGSGSSHHFPRDFLGTDKKTLEAAGEIDVAATPNLEETLDLLEDADVLVFSGNHGNYGKEEFQEALNDFADEGKGIVLVHAATWNHPWEGYNDRFVAGGTPSHGWGEFEVTVTDSGHAVTSDVPETFKITDENYRVEFSDKDKIEVCCENAADQTDGPIPSVWTVDDPKTRIVCITLGHDDKAHENDAYKTLLTNAVKWVSEKD